MQEEMVDSLDEMLHFLEEEMEEDTRQDVVLGWERINEGGWAWIRGEGLCPFWERYNNCFHEINHVEPTRSRRAQMHDGKEELLSGVQILELQGGPKDFALGRATFECE